MWKLAGRSGQCGKDGRGDATIPVPEHRISLWQGRDGDWTDSRASLRAAHPACRSQTRSGKVLCCHIGLRKLLPSILWVQSVPNEITTAD